MTVSCQTGFRNCACSSPPLNKNPLDPVMEHSTHFSLLIQARCLVNAKFKAAPIYNFTLTIDQMTRCDLKGLACSDEPTGTYLPALMFDSLLWSVLVSFS